MAINLYRHILSLIILSIGLAGCTGAKPGLRSYRLGDFPAAIKESTPYAEKGDPYSQWLLGSAYANAAPPVQDINKAEIWITKAAEQGFVPAMLDMAKISSLYKPVKDEHTAFIWYQKAADYGNSEAQFMVGTYHFSGTGGAEKDTTKAFTWWLLSAKQGHPLAKLMLDKSSDTISSQDMEKARQAAREWRPAKP